MKSKNTPLVSVIMPVFNAGEFLATAIESILEQTYPNFEFLIVDDGSVDSSWKIIKKYQRKYPKLIRAIKLKKNINFAGNGAVNFVLPIAKGKYIARMDADDISHPRRIEKQVEFLEKNKKVILVGTQALVIDSNGEIVGKKSFPLTHEKIYQKYAVVHPIIHPTCMIRRSALPDKDKIYQLKGGVNDDYYSFFCLLNKGEFANLPDYLFKYRVHGKNISLKNLKQKYSTISQIRKTAIGDLGYKISFGNRIYITLQDMFVKSISEDLLKTFYFLSKGFKLENANTL